MKSLLIDMIFQNDIIFVFILYMIITIFHFTVYYT